VDESWREVKVLVTGGSQGIGLGLTRAFAQQGATVTICGRDDDRLRATTEQLHDEGLEVSAVQADVASPEACERLVQEASNTMGGLDVLCTNAGVYPEQSIADLNGDDVDRILDTNLKGTMFTVSAALPHLEQSGRGRVVVTSSITGPVTGFPGLSAYAASKAGQLGFVRTAAVELAPSGITVNAILPGIIATEGLEGLLDDVDSVLRCIPIGRLGEPADIGALALFLASAHAGFVTGQAITVDGGQTLPELPTF
jgi:3-oxoacyl-[acyl-carrier protein] reductase